MAIGSAAPAAAQVANPGTAFATPNESLTTTVQYRRGWRGGRRSYGRSYNNRRYGYRRGGRGGSIGAGIAGLAAGAIIGGAIASQAAPAYGYAPGGNADAYCASRYRSYDPGSGTYLNYDGNRYPCP